MPKRLRSRSGFYRDTDVAIALLALWYLTPGPLCKENMSSWMTVMQSRASKTHCDMCAEMKKC